MIMQALMLATLGFMLMTILALCRIIRLEKQQKKRDKRIDELVRENTILRGMAAEHMPCHYCGIDKISKCPNGFPGCGLMDDKTAWFALIEKEKDTTG